MSVADAPMARRAPYICLPTCCRTALALGSTWLDPLGAWGGLGASVLCPALSKESSTHVVIHWEGSCFPPTRRTARRSPPTHLPGRSPRLSAQLSSKALPQPHPSRKWRRTPSARWGQTPMMRAQELERRAAGEQQWTPSPLLCASSWINLAVSSSGSATHGSGQGHCAPAVCLRNAKGFCEGEFVD